MRVFSGLMIAAWTALIAAPALAGPFDGNWIGQVPPIDKCPQQSVMTITIAGETLIGQVHNPGNARTLKGTIDADGNASFAVLPNFRGTMKFTGDHFDGNWNNGACLRHVLGDRAPDAAKTAELAAQRQQAQAIYDDLTTKAARGEKVDFTALRAAYPYTKQWDVFSNKTAPLMDQAKVAAKGGDCTAALEKFDEVLKIDYTIIVTHEMRSDCLKQTNKRDESRVESAIASRSRSPAAAMATRRRARLP